MNFTVYIYKNDRRCKSGERLVSTTVWERRDVASMEREVRELLLTGLYPVSDFRIEFFPVTQDLTNRPAYYDVEGGSMCNGVGRSYF